MARPERRPDARHAERWSCALITTCTRRSPAGCPLRRARRRSSSRSSNWSGGGSTAPSTSRCIEWSAKLGALEALESGCTAIIDHHESPNAIEGSLTVIADACAEVGVRVSTCYGVTDRHGAEGARRGLAENDRYLRAGGRGMVGVHAAFTCSDDTLAAAAELARTHQRRRPHPRRRRARRRWCCRPPPPPRRRRLADRARRASRRRPRPARHRSSTTRVPT